jgi:hypothetical protein
MTPSSSGSNSKRSKKVGGADVKRRPPDYAGFLFGLLCDPENEGVMNLRNVGLYRITCLYNPERGYAVA